LARGERLSSDEWLAGRVSMGSTRAFAVLYRRHHQALYRYCRSIVHDDDDAQDALQSAMTRALAALQARKRDVAVRPWLFRIVHNEAVSLLRRRRSHSSLVEGLEPVDGGLERTVEQRERFAGLIADLQCLAERQRAALVMRELSGLSIEEIAAALSTSTGAAKQSVFEARTALQEFEQGRAMECETVRRAISDGDRRVLRARKIRAHLRACRGCRDFELMISKRTAELHALAPPLPAVAASAILARLLAQGMGAGHSGAAAATSGTALTSHAAASVALKALAGVAIVGAATAGAVHIASSPDRHQPMQTPTQRSAPLRGVAVGPPESGRAAPGTSTTLRPGSGPKPYRAPAAKSRQAPGEATAAPGAAATALGGEGARAGERIVRSHGRSGGGSGVRVEHRHSGSAHSHTGRGHRSPKPAQTAPRQKAAKEGVGRTPAPATQHAPPRGGRSHTVTTVPNSESERPRSPTIAGG
ncbi:MAG TPA: sigma-70 family RNA polymerase sigma factor, partial [Solirubrobacteraceae bacterium]|nr:sigma-70 family RNA polymerase sigma factor [Solirubrobacteraceae bacterium]